MWSNQKLSAGDCLKNGLKSYYCTLPKQFNFLQLMKHISRLGGGGGGGGGFVG